MQEQKSREDCPPPVPMLLKASLRRHSPQDIYDYVQKHVGNLGMKIKKKQAIIGFETPELYEKLVNEHRVVSLRGGRLEFKPFPKAEENYILSEEEDEDEARAKSFRDSQLMANFPELFHSSSSLESMVNKWRFSVMGKVPKMFDPTLEAIRQKQEQLRREYKEDPLQRQMSSLESAVQKKLIGLQKKYERQLQRVNNFIFDFNLKPTIDLDPTFHFSDNNMWDFPAIPENNVRFEQVTMFRNSQCYKCKRLCPINGGEFAVSMAFPASLKKVNGFVKIYDVNTAEPKKTIGVELGAYGLCRVSTYLLIGSYDNTIKYVNLDDEEHQVETSRQLSEEPGTSFFELKVSKFSKDKHEILALNTDGKVRRFEVSFDLITQGIFTANFDLKNQINAEKTCITVEVVSPSEVLLGSLKKVKKYHMEREEVTAEIGTFDKPIKIKKINQHQFAVASSKLVEILDLRSEKIVQTFPHITSEIRSIEVIGEHSIMYGAKAEIGLLDDRKERLLPWKSEKHHQGMVYDILKLENRVVSCDDQGGIWSWKLAGEEPGVAEAEKETMAM